MGKLKQLHIDCEPGKCDRGEQLYRCPNQEEWMHQPSIVGRWVKKSVSTSQWNSNYSKLSYKLVEKVGNSCWIAYVKVGELESYEYELTPSEVRKVENEHTQGTSLKDNDRDNNRKESKAVKEDTGDIQRITIEEIPF